MNSQLTALVAGVGLFVHLVHKNSKVSTYTTEDPKIIDAFTKFKQIFGKSYGHDEHYYRFVNFKNNFKWIENHNNLYHAGKKSYYLEQCGSCWAFSTTGALEGLNAISSGKLLSFSEQQLVDCSSSYGNMGCNGGLMDYAFEYVKDNGITTESQYPYKGVDGTCQYSSSMSAFKNGGYVDVPSNSASQMKAALALGPVSVAIEADGYDFQLYSGGVFDDSSCGTQLDHGVLAVGYGNESGKDFYIVKNSWGGSWGDSGYIKIANNGDGPGICGIQMQASYPTA